MSHMQRALELARKALGTTSPNPAVGAVIVKSGQVIGEGYTQPPGSAHAEVMALRAAGSAAVGATMYVTLEPCCHYGRTPPCTRAIIEAGIAEVHIATLDPNPLVNGKGLAELQAAGIGVSVGEDQEAARELNEAYFKFITTGLPFVTAKFAMSLDGKIATHSGDSQWITGEAARRYANRLRATVDAVMVGVNTIIADDPQLTARDDRGQPLEHQPLRGIVDSGGRTPTHAQAFRGPGQTLIATTAAIAPLAKAALENAGAEVLLLPSQEGMVDAKALFSALGARGIINVMVEGGGTLLGSLFDAGLVDRVLAFVAPVIIGGRYAPTAVAGLGAATMGEALRLERTEVERIGDDVLIRGYVARSNPS